MSTSVDTMIDNAVSRASSFSDYSNSEAYKAISGVTFPELIKPKTKEPVFQSTSLTVDDDYIDLTEVEAFRAEMEAFLNDFFSQYFSSSSAYDAAAQWVTYSIQNGSATANGSQFDNIWNIEPQHVTSLGNDLVGLNLPVQAGITHIPVAISAINEAKLYSASRLNADLWQFAVAQQVRDLRAASIQATGNYMKALLNADVSVLNSRISILEAETSLKSAASDWFVAQLGPQKLEVNKAFTKGSENHAVEITVAEHKLSGTSLYVNSAIEAASTLAQVAQSAVSSMNNMISASTVGFE